MRDGGLPKLSFIAKQVFDISIWLPNIQAHSSTLVIMVIIVTIQIHVTSGKQAARILELNQHGCLFYLGKLVILSLKTYYDAA